MTTVLDVLAEQAMAATTTLHDTDDLMYLEPFKVHLGDEWRDALLAVMGSGRTHRFTYQVRRDSDLTTDFAWSECFVSHVMVEASGLRVALTPTGRVYRGAVHA